jgi:hypothetical protein
MTWNWPAPSFSSPATPLPTRDADHGLVMDAAAAATSSPNPSFSPCGGDGSQEREKTAVSAHPLYERLLEAHVACYRVAISVEQPPPHRRADHGHAATASGEFCPSSFYFDFTFLCSELHVSSNWILDCMLANLGYKLLWLISRNFDESFVAYHLFVIMFVLCCVLCSDL